MVAPDSSWRGRRAVYDALRDHLGRRADGEHRFPNSRSRVEPVADQLRNARTVCHTHTHADAYVDGRPAHRHTDADAHGDIHLHPDSDSDAHADPNGDLDSNFDSDLDPNAYSNVYSNSNSNGDVVGSGP
jgi:hypothetical protein